MYPVVTIEMEDGGVIKAELYPVPARGARNSPFNETNRRMKMDNEKKESAIVGCATIAIVFGFLATVATNLWLTWRICRAVEAILAK